MDFERVFEEETSAVNLADIRRDLSQIKYSTISEIELSEERNQNNAPPTREEVEQSISHLKDGKAPGPDGIYPEHIKYAGQNVVTWMTHIIQQCWATSILPKSWLHDKDTDL